MNARKRGGMNARRLMAVMTCECEEEGRDERKKLMAVMTTLEHSSALRRADEIGRQEKVREGHVGECGVRGRTQA